MIKSVIYLTVFSVTGATSSVKHDFGWLELKDECAS